MIRYLLHCARRHRTLATGEGFLHYYHCWTCDANWNGLVRHGRMRGVM